MVTGSHNPPDYNGFKMMLSGGPFFGEQIQELGRIADEGAYANGVGGVEDRPLFDDYIERLVRDFPGGRPLRVAWDAGNGAAGPATAALAAALPGQHTVLYAEIDAQDAGANDLVETVEVDLIAATRSGIFTTGLIIEFVP